MKLITKIEEKKFNTETELLLYSKQLESHSLRDVIEESLLTNNNLGGKGGLGQIVEKVFFGYALNSKQEADFKHLGRELKVAPLKEIKKIRDSNDIRQRLGLSAKERIVITIINYLTIINEDWSSATLKEKIRLIVMFYLHNAQVDKLDYIFKLVELWEPSEEDIKIIKSDWEKIVSKIKAGEAHNLSEGDTLYLGACTKGNTAESSLRDQPFSTQKAQQRAFCFKNSYVNFMISEILSRRENFQEKCIKLLSELDNNLDESLNRIFQNFKNKTQKEICETLDINVNLDTKQVNRLIVNKMLGGSGNSTIIELKKAGIETKVFRIDKNNKMPESVSFPAFSFLDIANESWDDSSVKDMFESTKFLFVIFKMNCTNKDYKLLSKELKMDSLILDKIVLWNMPLDVIDKDVKKTWEKTKEVILQGVPRRTVGKKTYNDFPSSVKEYDVVHIRPHGANAKDTNPLPNGESFTKQCFWLSKEYIEKIINQ